MKAKPTRRLRSIKAAAPGRYSHARFRRVLDALHVIETPKTGDWAVRTLGERGATKQFKTKELALAHALKIREGADVIVHNRKPKKPTVVKKSTAKITTEKASRVAER